MSAKRNRAAIVVAAFAATAAVLPSSAVAQENPVTIYGETLNLRTELVPFAKLDLSNARDQRRLKNRVGAAIERVCLRDIGRDGLQDRTYYACQDRALNNAAPQIAQAIARSGRLASASFAATAIRVSTR